MIETYIENTSLSEYFYIISVSREFINSAGIIIAYPIVCHYVARTIMVKRSNKQATFLSALPFTLVLLFGTVLGVPFFHKLFSHKSTTNPQLLVIYAIGFSLFILTLVIGFIAAITGHV